MNLLELQQRANVLVEKANAYEDSLQGVTWDEQDIINQHKYTDIFSLRPIMKLLFGSSITEKTNRTLDNDVALRVFASTAPMWNSSFNLLSYNNNTKYEKNSDYNIIGNPIILNGIQTSHSNTDYIKSEPLILKANLISDYTIPFIHVKLINTLTLNSSDRLTRQVGCRYSLNGTYIYDTTISFIGDEKVIYAHNEATNIYISLGTSIQAGDIWEYDIQFTGTDNKFTPIITNFYLNGTQISGTAASQTKSDCSSGINLYYDTAQANGFCDISIKDMYTSIKGVVQSVDYKSDQHEFMNDIHNYNNSNLITLDVKQNTLTDRDTRIKQGINYSYSANIMDALVTESQVANVFKWNTTTPETISNNTITTSRQVPGIVCYYLGNDYNGEYTATIPYNPGTAKLNQINYSTPPSYGAFYTTDPTTSQVPVRQGVLEEDKVGHEACRIFIPGMHFTHGKLESPQQIWQPDMKFGDSNTGLGYNWQGQALYHELVFKNRRSGSKKANVDFIPTLDSVADNDPQGLATRFALAQQKKYYKNRPWFNELDDLVDLDPTRLQKIIENNSYITTQGGSFDKSKFTVAEGGELDDNGILNDCSKKVIVTRLDITLTDELIIYGPKITFDINYTGTITGASQGFTVGKIGDEGYFNQDSYIAVGQSVGGGTVMSTINNKYVSTDIWRYDTDNIQNTILKSGTYQYIYNLKKVDDNVILTVTILNTSTNSTWATYTRTQAAETFNITDIWVGNDPLKAGETSKVYDLSSIKIVDQDDTVLFSAQAEDSKTYMTDEQFYNQFKLDYNMFAKAFGLPQ